MDINSTHFLITGLGTVTRENTFGENKESLFKRSLVVISYCSFSSDLYRSTKEIVEEVVRYPGQRRVMFSYSVETCRLRKYLWTSIPSVPPGHLDRRAGQDRTRDTYGPVNTLKRPGVKGTDMLPFPLTLLGV